MSLPDRPIASMFRAPIALLLLAACVDAPAAEMATASATATTEATATATATTASTATSTTASTSSGMAEVPEETCPADMVMVGRFCVDRFEAYLVDEAGAPHPYFERPREGVRYAARNDAGSFPQGYISRVESKKACEASDKRLCSRNEWQRACRFKGWGTFPYAGAGVRGRCNTGKLHLLTQLFPNPKGGMKYDEHFNSPDLNKTPGFLAKSGELAECVSDLGTADMVGNLHEWVSDTVTQTLVDKMAEEVERREQPWQEGNGVFMGGFFSTTSEHGPGCSFTTIAHEPAYHDYSTGFRCCKSLPPKPRKKKPQ